MSEWRECRLDELGVVVTGKTPSKNHPEDWGDVMPFITPSDYKNYGKKASNSERTLSEYGVERLRNKVLPKDSILVTCIGSDMGKVVMNDVEAITNQQINSIIPNQQKVSSNFLYYRLVAMYETLRIYGGDGTAVPIVNKGDFESLEADIPPLPEQKAIAEVLSSLDDKIDLLHRQNKTLEQMAETLFRQWFVEEAGEDWEEGTLDDIIDFNPNYRIPKGDSAPYLEMKNVSTSTFNPEDWYYRDFTSGMKFQNGDSIIARITPCLENGKTSYIAFLENGQVGWGSTEYIVMRMKEPFHNFISYLIAKDNDFRDFAISSMSGSSGRQRAQANTIKEYKFKNPTDEIIGILNEQLEPIVKKLIYNASQIPTLESLRDTLLPKLMSGQVRIASNG